MNLSTEFPYTKNSYLTTCEVDPPFSPLNKGGLDTLFLPPYQGGQGGSSAGKMCVSHSNESINSISAGESL